MTFFNFLFGIDLIIAAIALFFFADGLRDGSVSSSNLLFWLALLSAIGAQLVGALMLRAQGHQFWASLLLGLLAWPGLLFGLWFLALVMFQNGGR